MINTIQNNAYTSNSKNTCSREKIYENLFDIIKNNTEIQFDKKCSTYLKNYNIEKKDLFLKFFYFIMKQKIVDYDNFCFLPSIQNHRGIPNCNRIENL